MPLRSLEADAPLPLSLKSQRTVDQPISYFMQQAVENPRLISLAAGLVDAESLPGVEVLAACQAVLGSPQSAQAALQYGTTQGHAPLRDLLVERACAQDGKRPVELSLTADDCIVTTGSQQLLYLVSEALLDPGDIVITQAPSYFVFQGTLHSAGARVLAVPTDDEGMDVDALADLLRRMNRSELARVRLIYVVDYFDNPGGTTLSLQRREQLLNLVRRYSREQRILILEDAAYRELRYDGADLPSIKSLDGDNKYVLLSMTFSKPLAPGVKTGYAFLPRGLKEPLLRLKGNHDFGSSNLIQHVLHHLLATGMYDRHLERLREVYRHKRDVMLQALEHEFPAGSGVSWRRPAGGLYVWVRFPDSLDTGPDSALMRAALEEGVLYVPGSFCYVNGATGTPPRNEMRLSFGVVPPDSLREGIRRLSQAVRRTTLPRPATALRPAHLAPV
jgi:2-aminoadipate transaminase